MDAHPLNQCFVAVGKPRTTAADDPQLLHLVQSETCRRKPRSSYEAAEEFSNCAWSHLPALDQNNSLRFSFMRKILLLLLPAIDEASVAHGFVSELFSGKERARLVPRALGKVA